MPETPRTRKMPDHAPPQRAHPPATTGSAASTYIATSTNCAGVRTPDTWDRSNGLDVVVVGSMTEPQQAVVRMTRPKTTASPRCRFNASAGGIGGAVNGVVTGFGSGPVRASQSPHQWFAATLGKCVCGRPVLGFLITVGALTWQRPIGRQKWWRCPVLSVFRRIGPRNYRNTAI